MMNHTLNISPFIVVKQYELIEDVRKKLRVFVHIHWKNNTILPVYSSNDMLFESVTKLQEYHQHYYKMPYEIKIIKVVEKVNKNPHIKLLPREIKVTAPS